MDIRLFLQLPATNITNRIFQPREYCPRTTKHGVGTLNWFPIYLKFWHFKLNSRRRFHPVRRHGFNKKFAEMALIGSSRTRTLHVRSDQGKLGIAKWHFYVSFCFPSLMNVVMGYELYNVPFNKVLNILHHEYKLLLTEFHSSNIFELLLVAAHWIASNCWRAASLKLV